MIFTMKDNCLVVPVFLFQIVFVCAAFAHIESTKLFPSDGSADDAFGISVAADGNLAVVGAYQNDTSGLNSGAAYVYERFGSQWFERQKLTPSDGAAGDQFGRSVAVQGNTIVVGSYYDDSSRGSAYIFTPTDSGWTQQQKLTAPDAAANDRFGVSVAIDNNTIVIGAYRRASNTGCAFVFTRNGSAWDFQQTLTASDAQTGEYFGYTVAIDGNTIIVGAYYGDISGVVDAGKAYVYQREGSTWTEQCILHASDYTEYDHFGYSIAIDSNFAVIGAYEGKSDTITGSGAAYVFENTGSSWVERQKLIDSNAPAYGEDFGWSAAMTNGTIFVGSPFDYFDGNQVGAVYEFIRDGEVWIPNGRLMAGDPNIADRFGASLALSGGNLFIGATYNKNNDANTGSTYVFSETDVLVADFDGDSDVDFFDFAFLGSFWNQNNAIADIAPFPGDGIVDIKDLSLFCGSWLAGK